LVRKGLSEREVQEALGDLDRADLPARTVAALRLADCLSGERPVVDDGLFALLRRHFDEGQILEVIALAGYYHAISFLCVGLKLPLESYATRFPAPASA